MSRTIWLHGRPSSGKTTIAKSLSELIDYKLLDGDDLREKIGGGLGYTREDRNKQAQRIIDYRNSLDVYLDNIILTTNSHFENNRNLFRTQISNLIEVYVNCPLEVCIERDVKGLYHGAQEGTIKNMPGIDELFEEPSKYDITINTSKMNVYDCVMEILNVCLKKYLI